MTYFEATRNALVCGNVRVRCVRGHARESDVEGVTPRNKTFLHRRAICCAAESELGVFNRPYPLCERVCACVRVSRRAGTVARIVRNAVWRSASHAPAGAYDVPAIKGLAQPEVGF